MKNIITETIKGYKATDANMRCRGYQFKLGKEFVHDGKLEMYKSGFHFCIHPSGAWYHYNSPGTRVFEIEATNVLDERDGDGAEVKMVAQKIRFIREINITGDGNTGDGNTGDYNTGDFNTGDYNTGRSNTGDFNTGDYNTGDYNTGHCNAGDYNAGDYNAGDYNAGIGNATDFSSGFFCKNIQKVKCFDIETNLTRNGFINKYPEYYDLSCDLLKDDKIDFKKYKNLPGITKTKLTRLHYKFKKARGSNEK